VVWPSEHLVVLRLAASASSKSSLLWQQSHTVQAQHLQQPPQHPVQQLLQMQQEGQQHQFVQLCRVLSEQHQHQQQSK
jgi:hypothetical protein